MKQTNSRILGKPGLNREINKAQVLDILRRRRTVSRAELVRITGIQANTISYIVEELFGEGLVRVVGPGKSTGGRQPMMIECVGDGMRVIGIELEPEMLSGVLLNFEGTVTLRISASLPSCKVSDVIKTIKEIVSNLIKRAGLSRQDIEGIGIGLPGIISARDHHVFFSSPLKWRDVDVGSLIEQTTGLPVRLLNNAMSGAVSIYDMEPYHSQSSLLHYLVFLDGAGSRSSTGIGCGIILNGRPYVGRDNLAGELATWLEHPIARAERITESGPVPNMRTLVAATRKDPERYNPLWDSFAQDLAREVSQGISYLNPHAVVISSDCPELESLIGKNLLRHMEHFTVAGSMVETISGAEYLRPSIVFHEHDPDAIARGAALPFILDRTLPPQLETGVLL